MIMRKKIRNFLVRMLRMMLNVQKSGLKKCMFMRARAKGRKNELFAIRKWIESSS